MAVSYTKVAGLGPSTAGLWFVVAIDDVNPSFNKVVAQTYQEASATQIVAALS